MVLQDWRRHWLAPQRIPARLIQPLIYLLILGSGYGGASVLGPRGYPKLIFPGVVALSMLTGAMYNGANIVLDRERGFFKAVLVAPVSRLSIALGKVASGAMIGILNALPLLLAAPLVGLQVGPWQILGFLGALAASAMAVSSLSIAVSCRMSLTMVFHVINNVVMLPMYFASGALFPLHSAPAWLQGLAYLNPLAYGVDLLRAALNEPAFFPPALSIGILGFVTVAMTWSTIAALEKGEDL